MSFSAAFRCALFAATALAAAQAHADGAARPRHGNTAAADVLFDRGQKAMAEGRLDQACKLFDASFKVEASVGAMLNLALCHDKRDMTATAFSEYKKAAKLAYELKDARQPQIEGVAAKLEKRLSKLTVYVERAPAGLTIAVDDLPLPAESFGVALPYDAGERVVTARARGFAPWTATVTLKARGDNQTVAVPRLQPARRGKGQLIAGGVIAGLGAAALIGGIGAGVHAIGLKSTVSGEVDANKDCLPSAASCVGDEKALTTTANVSTGLLIGGGALAVAGIVVLATAPRGQATAATDRAAWLLMPLAGPGTAGLMLSGAF